jgi:hypothetical protein
MSPHVVSTCTERIGLFSTILRVKGLNMRIELVERAGKAGHSLLFLLPSERQFLEVLEVAGLKGMTAM